MSVSTSNSSWLKHAPPTLFGAVMGVTGLGLAWRKANEVLGLPEWPSHLFLAISGMNFIGSTILYMIKFVRYPDDVPADTYHPIQSNFFFSLFNCLYAASVSYFAFQSPMGKNCFFWYGR
jgi:tellurite resistance protein TehA-like permease